MRMREVVVIAAFAAAVVVPIHAQPSRGPARRLPRAAGNQINPATASDGVNFLAAWEDRRAGDAQIVMTLVAGGEALSPNGIIIGGGRSPVVAWTGRNYVAAWLNGSQLSYARVSRSGDVIDAKPRTIAGTASAPSIASNGSITLITTRTDDGQTIFAVDANANVVDSISRRTNGDYIRVVAVGDHFELINGGFTSSITFDGKLHWGGDRFIDTFFFALSAASNGQRALVTYTRDEFPQITLCARTIEPDGTIGPRVEITHGLMEKNEANGYLGGYFDPIWATATAADRNGFTVAWQERSGYEWSPLMEESKHHSVDYQPSAVVATYDLQAATFDASGKLRGKFALATGDASDEAPAIASNGSSLFTLWIENFLRYPGAQKITAGISDFHRAASRLNIATSISLQDSPRIVAGDSGYLVVWREETRNDGFGKIMAQRYDRNGNALEAPRQMSDSPNAQSAPAVAFDGHQFLIAWIDQNPFRWNIYSRRMTPQGELLDATPQLRTVEGIFGLSFGLASNGSGFAFALVPLPLYDIVAVNSSWIDTSNARRNSEVAMAPSGSDYVVAWQTGKFNEATIAAASASAPSVRRLNSVWYDTPVMACSDASCLTIAWKGFNARTLVIHAFHPLFDVPSNDTPLAWTYGSIRIANRGHEFVAIGKSGDTLRGEYLNADGSPASSEMAIVTQSLINTFNALDVAMSSNGFAVAYAAPNDDDGALRIFVKTVNR